MLRVRRLSARWAAPLRRRRWVAGAAAALGLGLAVGCAGPVQVSSEQAADASLQPRATFALGATQMLPAGGWEPEEIELLQRAMHQAFLAMLAEHGYREVPRQGADMVIGYRFVIRRLAEAVGDPREQRSQEMAEGGDGGIAASPQEPAGFSGQAVLSLQVSEPGSERRLWEGTAEYEINSLRQGVRDSERAVRRLGEILAQAP